MGPLLLKPNLISPVWSGGAINRLRGIEGDVAYGESFDVSVHRGLVNDVEGGLYNGTPLDELLAGHRAEIMGDLTDDGVIQIITMSAAQSLSVQVHPDEAYAQVHEDDHEKTESWYIVEAEPGATIILGSETDDIDALRAAAADDTIGDKYGRRVPVSEGDFVCVPAGTLHALGAGVLAVEVGSLGFCTYRICDWGRGRELHVRKAFDVLRTQNRPDPVHLGSYDPAAPASVRRGVTHRLFIADVADVRGSWEQELDGRYHVLSCVGGAARVTCAEGSAELTCTRSLLMPASAGSYVVEGNCRVIRSYAACPGEVA